jgi:NADH-quinone oxidoreductase subunit J
VLFLFVVMMLDINFRELRQGINTYLPFGVFVGVVLFIELAFLVFQNWVMPASSRQPLMSATPSPDQVSNTRALGQLIYTHYLYVFQVAGLILLVAMIGAIVLTLRHRTGVERQSIRLQVGRKRADVLSVQHVTTGAGAPVQ